MNYNIYLCFLKLFLWIFGGFHQTRVVKIIVNNEAAEALHLMQYFKTTVAIVVSAECLLGSWLNHLVTAYLLYQ